ncbi:hypothetical protein EG329_001722 [Mollisiaceae sp. DMI_Dod_QoI]|nr:hypothetical protein EG329_001722 [Helotiales sp. DMI_Dod_QoI]
MLCQFCHSIVSADEDYGQRSRSASDVEEAALANCYFCYWILQRYQRSGSEIGWEHSPFTITYKVRSISEGKDGLWLEFRIPHPPGYPGGSMSRGESISFILLPDSHIGRPIKRIPTGFSEDENWRASHESIDLGLCDDLPSSTDHIDVAAIAKTWLRNCEDNHKSCGKIRDPSYRPKRLIFIDRDEVRLTLSDARLPQETYATLSYCWGPDPKFLKLRVDNMDDLMKGVILTDLPRTFHDAIKTARRLGIANIWIDSLCIIQSGPGSKEDWEEQAGLMKKIYANAVLNISASKAVSAEEGFFTSRRTEMLVPHKLWKRFPESTSNVPKRVTAISWDQFAGQMLSWPVGKRGWIFQERLLAPRMLHFGPDQIYWECDEVPRGSEMFTGGVTFSSAWDFGSRATDFTLQAPMSGSFGDQWMDIVKNYSMTQLTNPAMDKLLAIGGVAQSVAALRRDEYIAGFFRRTLPHALLWNVDQDANSDTILDESGIYRAPSWSWASTDMPIQTHLTVIKCESNATYRTLATVKDITIKLTDVSNLYGRLDSGEICIHGFLLTVQVKVVGDLNDHHRRHFVLESDHWKPSEDERFHKLMAFDDLSAWKRYASTGDLSNSKMRDVLLFLIADTTTATTQRIHRSSLGLILSPVEGSNRYTRIGIFSLQGPGSEIYDSIVTKIAPQDVVLI